MRVLIFGGSFNPPTLAHEAIIRACLHLPQFDEVWLMVSGSRLDKHIAQSDDHRLQLLQRVVSGTFADNPHLHISDFELHLPRPTQTYRTVSKLAEAYPGTEFWFAYGGDAYRSMSTWPHASEFMHDLRVVVCTDQKMSKAGVRQAVRLTIPAPYTDMSSTAVRAGIAVGLDVSGMVSSSVLKYITLHGLYAPAGDRPS